MTGLVSSLLGLWGCAYDDITLQPEPDIPSHLIGKGKPYYAAINVNTNSGRTTRAGNVGPFTDDPGDTDERALYLDYPEGEVHHVLILFDKNGQRVGFQDPETNETSYLFPLTLTPVIEEEKPGDDGDGKGEETPGEETPGEPGEETPDEPEVEEPASDPIIDTYEYLYAQVPEDIVSAIEDGGKVLSVVNASTELVNRLKDLNGVDGGTDYEKFQHLLQTSIANSDYFLFSDNARYHTMTSSMVVRNSEVVAAADGVLRFWRTPAIAQKYPYTLYVERLLAKYSVSFKDPASGKYFYLSNMARGIEDGEDTDDPEAKEDVENKDQQAGTEAEYRNKFIFVPEAKKLKYVTNYTRRQTIDEEKTLTIAEGEWKINVVGWGVNNFEQKQYLFKSLDPSKTYYTGWASNYRTYWGEDTHYSTQYYPDQYSTVRNYKLKKTTVPAPDTEGNEENTSSSTIYEIETVYDHTVRDYESMEKGDLTDNPLTCYSFDEIVSKDLIKYTPENTYDAAQSGLGDKPFETQSYLRVGSHLIVGAQLLINGFDDLYTSTDTDAAGLIISRNQNVKTKLYMNDIYWTEEAYMNYVAEYLGYYMMDSENYPVFGENDGYLYINKEGGKADAHHFYLSDANIKGGDGWVFLCPDPGVKFYVRDPNYVPPKTIEEGDESEGDNQDSEVEEIEEYFEIDHLKLVYLAYQHPELMAKRYDRGRMYYVSPTYHADNITSGMVTGRFGTVRNHWYDFRVDKIENVGSPVSDPGQPIVPNNEPIYNGVAIKMKVLGWHGEYEDVDISGQHPGGVPGTGGDTNPDEGEEKGEENN